METSGKRLVCIVEDEVKLADLLAEYLQQAGFASFWVADGNQVVSECRRRRPDLLLLDLMLPGKDGFSLCRELRTFTQIPILITTARVEEIDRLLGLELGADDYICKPYSPREVVARVKAVFRRLDAAAGSPLPAGFEVEEERYRISVQGLPLDLTPVEFRLLATLLAQPGCVFGRNQLMDRLYRDHRIVTDRTIDSHIKNLRKKLAEAVPGADYIKSVYGVGYKLEA